MSERPHRRFTCHIRVGGDTIEDVRRELEEIWRELRPGYESVSGCASSGHIVTLKEDPTMTPEAYRAALERFVGAREVPGMHPERPAKGDDWDGDCG